MVIKSAPLSTPIASEVFLIQSQGMERWLSQQLAAELSVWANYRFLFPAKFFSQMAKAINAELNDADYDRHLILWRLEAMLRQLAKEEFAPLQAYLSGAHSSLKRYQLAQQLSQLFDQYQIMRPELLAHWQQGRCVSEHSSERWQQVLWQHIHRQIAKPHRGDLWQAAIAKLNQSNKDAYSAVLPERVSIFGLHTLPPLFLQFIQGLARHCQVHLFLLNPSQDFWADLPGRKQALLNATEAEPCASGHPLLISLGQQGREFQDMLLEYNVTFELELDSFEASPAFTLLHQLQNDILSNHCEPRRLNPDQSISFHACHSRLREVEVLKDQLLDALNQDNTLALRDIVVMAPDIQVYEPFINAVFADIPHAVADRSIRLSNHALAAFIQFLQLSGSRMGWQSVMDLLAQPCVYTSFNLVESDLDLIGVWLEDTHVRWAKSAEHKTQFGLPATAENTWQATIDRLLMGYAVGHDDEFVAGILPYRDIEGSSAQALGGLSDFLQLLFKADSEFSQAKPLKTWATQLRYYAEYLLNNADATEREQLNDLLLELNEGLADVHHYPVERAVIINWLEGAVAERKSSNGFLRGQLTFCSMLPMRSIPFKIIALLGMNDGEFPKIERAPSFDLISQKFRKGDRSRRNDDRYQFLEILLSTRQQLIISFVGQSETTNEKIPPSVVISELLDVIEQSYQLTQPIHYHPLHAHHPSYFTESSTLRSYSATDCITASMLNQSQPPKNSWWQGFLEHTQQQEIIDLAEFFAYFQHPQRYFVRRQLGVYYTPINADAEEREPFAVNRLDAYSIQQHWLQQRLKGQAYPLNKLVAQGLWPGAALGELEYRRQQQELEAFVQNINAKCLGESLPDLIMDIALFGYRVIGKLSHRYQNGSLLYRYAPLKGKDFMAAWLHHLLINQISTQTTHLLSSDAELTFLPEHAHSEQLNEWLKVFQAGQIQPGAFFVEAAFAYIKQQDKLMNSTRAGKPALDAAREQLEKTLEQPFEPEFQRLYTLADLELILTEPFVKQCETLLLPVWQAVQ